MDDEKKDQKPQGGFNDLLEKYESNTDQQSQQDDEKKRPGGQS